MVGQQVSGKRLGIIGMGRVGQIVAKRAQGFDMTVHYFNRHRLEPALEKNAIFHKDLHSMLAVSDFIIGYWWLILIIIVAAVFFGKRYAKPVSSKKRSR